MERVWLDWDGKCKGHKIGGMVCQTFAGAQVDSAWSSSPLWLASLHRVSSAELTSTYLPVSDESCVLAPRKPHQWPFHQVQRESSSLQSLHESLEASLRTPSRPQCPTVSFVPHRAVLQPHLLILGDSSSFSKYLLEHQASACWKNRLDWDGRRKGHKIRWHGVSDFCKCPGVCQTLAWCVRHLHHCSCCESSLELRRKRYNPVG